MLSTVTSAPAEALASASLAHAPGTSLNCSTANRGKQLDIACHGKAKARVTVRQGADLCREKCCKYATRSPSKGGRGPRLWAMWHSTELRLHNLCHAVAQARNRKPYARTCCHKACAHAAPGPTLAPRSRRLNSSGNRWHWHAAKSAVAPASELCGGRRHAGTTATRCRPGEKRTDRLKTNRPTD